MIEEGVFQRDSRSSTAMTSIYGVIRKTPTTLNKDGQLNLVNRDIHSIGDKLPAKIALTIIKLYLSGNFLTDLCHLDQFQNLRTVSLMNNNLRYLETLQPLGKLKNLEVLSLGGNVVSKMPYYLEHIVVLCKSLRRLDDMQITNADRLRAVERFHKITAFYSKLRENELRNSVLVHVSKLMSCHLEMRREVFGRFSHILGEHIGASLTEKENYGAGRILQQALEGGVFCWLQRMDNQHLSRMVQNTLFKLLLAEQQQRRNAPHASFTSNQPPIVAKRGGAMLTIAGVAVSSATLTGGEDHGEVWAGVVGSYLREQYEFYLDLSRYCEHLQSTYRRLCCGEREDSAGTQLSAVALDQDLLGHCVEALRVLPAHSAVDSETSRQCFCGGDRGSCGPSPRCRYHAGKAEGGGRDAGFPHRARTPLVSVLNVLQQQPQSAADAAPIMVRNKLPFAESRGGVAVGKENTGAGHTGPAPRLTPAPCEGAALPHPLRSPASASGINRQQRGKSLQLPAEGVSGGVQDRYAQLLADLAHKRGDAASGNSIAAGLWTQQRGTSAAMLPPQQPDPDAAPALNPPPQQKAAIELAPRTFAETLGEHVASPTAAPPVAELHNLSEQDVRAFIARAMESPVLSEPAGNSEMEGGGVLVTEELQKLSREMEARFLSEAQRVEERLCAGEERALLEESRAGYSAYREQHCSEQVPRCDGIASAAPGQSIHSLHMSIKALAARYTLCTIEEVRLYKTNAALATTVIMLHKQSVALVNRAAEELGDSGQEVGLVNRDARAGAVYLQVLRADLHLVEEVQEKIAVLREAQHSLREEEELMAEQLRAVEATSLAVTSCIQTAVSEREEAELKISGDPALFALARRDRARSLAAAFWENSRSCQLLKRCMFHSLRRNVRRQQKVKCFQHQQQRRRSMALKLLIFKAWARCTRTAFRAAQLASWRNRMSRGKALHAWLHSYAHSALRLPALQARHRRRCLERAFTAMQQCMLSRQKKKQVQTRQELYVALFHSVRIFRAWRSLVRARRQQVTGYVLAERRHALTRAFASWTSAALYVRTLRLDSDAVIRNRLQKRICSQAFAVWYRLFCYRSMLSIYRCKRRYFLGLLRRLAQRSSLRAQVQWVVTGAAALRLREFALRRACRRWSLFLRRQTDRVLAGRRLRTVYSCRLLSSVWRRWAMCAQRCSDFHRRFAAVQSRCQLGVLDRCWRLWYNTAVVDGQERGVLNKGQQIKDAWLRMFDDTTAVRISSTAERNFNSKEDPAAEPTLLAHQATGAGEERTHYNHQSALRRRHLVNFTPVELQLLYWDSDSDSESQQREEGELVEDGFGSPSEGRSPCRAQFVLVGRYWRRWRGRHRCRAELQVRSALVQRLAAFAECRRRFGGWCAAFLRTLSERAAFYSRSPDASELESYSHRCSEIERRGEHSRARIAELRPLLDGLTASMTESRQAEAQQETELRDLVSSVATLLLEKTHLEGRKRQARDFISSMQRRREQFIEAQQSQQAEGSAAEESSNAGFVPPQLSSLMGMLSVIGSTDAEPLGALVGGLYYSPDERLLLMQDVEALYSDAVAAQEKLTRQKQHLSNQKAAAAALLEVRQQQAAELDGQIAALRAERAVAQGALAECRDRVGDTLREVETQTRFQEDGLAALAAEEEHLQEQLAVLTREEKNLVHALSERNYLAQLGGSGAAGALLDQSICQELARQEADATDLLLAVRAAAAGKRDTAAVSSSTLVPSRNQQPIALHALTRKKSKPVQRARPRSDTARLVRGSEEGSRDGRTIHHCAEAAASRGEEAGSGGVEGRIDALSARIRSRLTAAAFC